MKLVGVECYFIIVLCENMIGFRGLRFGDILIVFNGKIIEVNNIDVEGCLMFVDVLVYVDKMCGVIVIVDCVIFIGVIIVAFGNDIVGFFFSKDVVVKCVEDVVKVVGEDFWCMFMFDFMWFIMKFEIVDMKNIGFCGGGFIIVAFFLK